MKCVTGNESSPLLSWAARSVGLYSVTRRSFASGWSVLATLGSSDDACPSPKLYPMMLWAHDLCDGVPSGALSHVHGFGWAFEAPVAEQHHPCGIRGRRLDLLEPGGGCAFGEELLALPDHHRAHPQVHLVDQALAEQRLQQVRAAPRVDLLMPLTQVTDLGGRVRDLGADVPSITPAGYADGGSTCSNRVAAAPSGKSFLPCPITTGHTHRFTWSTRPSRNSVCSRFALPHVWICSCRSRRSRISAAASVIWVLMSHVSSGVPRDATYLGTRSKACPISSVWPGQ